MKQKGFVTLSGLIFFILLIFCGYLAIKAGPLYYENYQIKNILQSVVNDPANEFTMSQTPAVTKMIVKRFHVNQIQRVNTTDIKMSTTNGKLTLSVAYDAKAKLFYNLYFLAHFENQAVRN